MATNPRHQETSECRTFREHYDSLYRLIQDPLSLATRMYSQGIITPAVKEQMNVLGVSRLEKNYALLNVVEMQLQTNPSVVHVFLSALKEDPSMQSLVESMERGLLSTTSAAHEGVQSRDGCEEQRIQEENSMSLVSGLDSLSLHGESATLPGHIEGTYQHSRNQHWPQELPYHHSSLEPFYHSPFHSPPHQVGHQPPFQSHPHYPSLEPPPVQPSYQHTERIQPPYYHPSHHPPNPQHSHLLTSTNPHQQSSYQTHYQMPLESVYVHHPPYQQHSPYHSVPSLGKPTFQHPRYSQPSNFQRSQLLPFQLANPYPNQTAFHQDPFIHAHQPSHQPSRQSPFQLPPHSGSPLEEYAIFLRAYYTHHHAPCTKWPQLHTRRYINLAVISNDYANREDLVQFRKQTIHGSIDDILEWKAPIRMKDILRPNCVYDSRDDKKHEHHPVTQLLIEGAPGIGKSTFAWEVCQKWGQHQLFNEYSLVVLLKFRDKRVHGAKSVSDLFYHPHSKLQSDIVQHICFMGGHRLLLILEGFDEVPASEQTMDSIFVRLFTGQELPKATVILTTRPSASGELRPFCNSVNSRRIEIVGFGKKEIDEYIQCAFSDKQSRSDFKEYLSLYPHIHSMMYVPLNSAIVTHVYESCKSSGAVVPKTMTQLYSSLIRTLLLRYLKGKEEYKDTCTTINSFKDLPQPVYDQFCEICKMAYTGIVCAKTELIFQDLPSDFDSLGLMQSCPELYVDRGACISYNFLHLTIQEYLAAYHISQQSVDEQVAFMKERIKSAKLEVVVRFLAGFNELGRDLWDVVRGFASDDQHNIRLEILHWLFESQNPSVITSVLGSDHVSFHCYSSLPFDLYVLGYCIAHSSCDWKLTLVNCKRESVELFLRALNLQQDQCRLRGKIKEMWLYEAFNASISAAVHLLVENMAQLLVFHNLTHLSLTSTDVKCLQKCGNHLSKQTKLLQQLEYLQLCFPELQYMDLPVPSYVGPIPSYVSPMHSDVSPIHSDVSPIHSDVSPIPSDVSPIHSDVSPIHSDVSPIPSGVNLITSLSKLRSIRQLNLCYTGYGFELLTISKHEEVLNIPNKLSSDSVQLIIDGLSHNTSLEKLNMSGSNFSSENLLHLASVLRVNTRLRVLKIERCNIQSSDSVHLAKALEENTTTQLQSLWLGSSPIGSEGAVAFASMLATNKSLAELNMRQCSIRGEGAVCLAKALEKNSTVREFDISCNPIGSEGAVAFADTLATNKSLDILNMSKCSIQGEGAVCLAKALEKNSTVREFDISCNPIGSEGAVAFASMLKKNQCLKTLNLYDGSVGVEGALELIESLKHNTTLEVLELSDECQPISFSTLDKTLQDRVKLGCYVDFSNVGH